MSCFIKIKNYLPSSKIFFTILLSFAMVAITSGVYVYFWQDVKFQSIKKDLDRKIIDLQSQLEAGSASNIVCDSSESIQYKNDDHGFVFDLPGSWNGYTVMTEKWQGESAENIQSSVIEGVKVVIRDPRWTSQNPRQDIPVMIFTLQQWQDLADGKFYIGPAPVGPSELGRNNKYVFALPARYNYAFLPGYEEVDQIVYGNYFYVFNLE